jgi:hypothetical protein
MRPLLDNAFAPFTFSIGFLEAPLASVGDVYLAWSRPHFTKIDIVPVEAHCQAALRLLEPLTMPPRRKLLYGTASQWTAYFDNGSRGPDPFTPVCYLAQQVGCRGVIATCIPHTLHSDIGQEKGTYGAVKFELFGPTQKKFLNYERSVSVVYDSKWRFAARGDMQPFEEVQQYTAKRIVDRLTPEMLHRYCSALGIRLFDDDFYTGPGLLFAINDPLPSQAKEMTLEEARRELALI